MKKFSMKKIAAAVSVGVVLGVGAQAASAESLLFPYYKFGAGVYSFLSFVNLQASNSATDNKVNIHYMWQRKSGGITNLLGGCGHADLWAKVTQNDMVFQSIQPSSQGGVQVGTMIGDGSGMAYLDTPADEGFMTLSNYDAAYAPGAENSLLGEMIVIDTTNGVASAMKGMNNPGTTAEGDFSAVWTAKPAYVFNWYPTNESGSKLGSSGVDTKWIVTVTNNLGLVAGTANQLMTSDPYHNTVRMDSLFIDPVTNSGLVFNNDEAPMSGIKHPLVKCMGAVTRSDLLDTPARNFSRDGGFEGLWMTQGTMDATNTVFSAYGAAGTPNAALPANQGANVFKLESSAVLNRSVISVEQGWWNLPY